MLLHPLANKDLDAFLEITEENKYTSQQKLFAAFVARW